MGLRDVPPTMFVELIAKELKKFSELQPPEWSHYVKTGVHRERRPEQLDWWYRRAASILRRISLNGPIGVSRLRTYYGGRQKRGSAPEHSRKGSGKIIRVILQQLEKAGLVIKVERGGRKVTPKGTSLLARLASQAKAGE